MSLHAGTVERDPPTYSRPPDLARVRAIACPALLIHLKTRPLRWTEGSCRLPPAPSVSTGLSSAEASAAAARSGDGSWTSASLVSRSGKRLFSRRSALPWIPLLPSPENRARISVGVVGMSFSLRAWGCCLAGCLPLGSSRNGSESELPLFEEEVCDVPPFRLRPFARAPLETLSFSFLPRGLGPLTSSAESLLETPLATAPSVESTDGEPEPKGPAIFLLSPRC